jgi:hypothetical protein
MLLWIEHATIEVVLWASSVSMLLKLPILIVPPRLGAWAYARPASASGSPAPASTADQPSTLRTVRRLTSSRTSSFTTSNPSRLFMLGLLWASVGSCRV